MTKLSVSGTVKLASGETRSVTVREGASSIVIRLKSANSAIGCLIVQFGGNGKPFIRLHREAGIDIVVPGFRQFRLSDFIEERRS